MKIAKAVASVEDVERPAKPAYRRPEPKQVKLELSFQPSKRFQVWMGCWIVITGIVYLTVYWASYLSLPR